MVLSLVVLTSFESSLGSTLKQPARLIDEPEKVEVSGEVRTSEAEAQIVADSLSNEQQQVEAVAEVVKQPQTISKFDNLMKRIGAETGYDWRFMSAIAYCESRFKEGLVSKRGATGLMQVMPIVARHFKVPVSQLHHTETNVRLACKLLNESEQKLCFPEGVDERDRLSIILACYNAGLGHVQDARRLAKADGANPNSWSVVSKYLKLKADPAYYTRPEVKAGRFRGSKETIGFVTLAMSKYDEYCEIAW